MKRIVLRGLAPVCLLGGLVSTSVVSCVVDPSGDVVVDEHAIINGTPATANQFPTIVGIFMHSKSDTSGKGGLCTGTLISPTAVLTAGHCVWPAALRDPTKPTEPAPTDVEWIVTYSLDFKATPPDQRLAVASVDRHEKFPNLFSRDNPKPTERGPGRWDDIGIVHLAKPVTGKQIQKLATAAEAAAALKVGDSFVVAGYGMTSNTDQKSAGVLTNGKSKLDAVGTFEIALGDQNDQQACHGDSGGPVMTTAGVQLGIASRINIAMLPAPDPKNPPKCETGLLYTRVDYYADWIKSKVPDLGQQPAPDPGGGGAPDAGPGSGGGGSPDAGTGNPGDPGGDDGDETGGCGCQTGGGNTAGGLLAIGAIGGFLARRRRR